MAENDFLSGLLGGVKDVGSSIYGGVTGLLGGGEQAPAGGNQMQSMLSQLSPDDQKRLMYSTLGQIGATLLAAGQKQSGESRAQALAQLGKIGPGIEESLQRAAMLQQQKIAAQRQAELFPLQKQQLMGQVGAQEIAQGTAILGLMGQKAKLEQNIQALKSLGMDTTAQQRQLDIYNQYITRMAPSGVQAAIAAPAAAPAPTQAAPAAPQEAMVAPSPAPVAAAELPAPTAPVAAPAAAAAPAVNQQAQMLQQQFPYVPVNRAISEIQTGGDVTASLQKLMDLNEKNKADQMKAEGDLRKEFNPKAERFDAIQKSYASLSGLKNLDTGIADEALIMSFYKIFDPTSVISTTESGKIVAASGAVDKYGLQMMDRIISGKRLTPEMRANLIASAKAKFDQEYNSYERAFNQARETAKEFVDPNRAIPDVRDPQIMATVARERDLADISRKITPKDILTLGIEDLENLDPAKMSKPARDAVKARLDLLQLPPPVAASDQPQQPQQGYGLGRNPLRGAMQAYPRGLLREDQLPPVGY